MNCLLANGMHANGSGGGGGQVFCCFFFQAARGRRGLATTRGGLVPTKYVRKSGGSDYCAAKWEPCARGAMTNVAS